MSFIEEEIAHVKGRPKKLAIFLHGYIDSAASLDKHLAPMVGKLDDIALHIPEAPCECEIYSKKCQWYSMHRFDPNDDRVRVESFSEYIRIYDRAKPGIAQAFSFLEDYIAERLEMYGLAHKDLYLCGFSQGATLAIYAALMLPEKIAGCASFSGIVAPAEWLAAHHRSSPDMLLIHNQDDPLVRFQSLVFSAEKLREMGCEVKAVAGKAGQHRITEKGLKAVAEFMKR